MNSKNKFLEIVVPTFNRDSILACTLNELAAAVSTQKDHLSLRVIDNCSTDNTPVVISSFEERGLLQSQRNEDNIGLIKNIAKCIDTSNAEWVWVFGDDDHILLHCLPALINALRGLPQDIVFARGLNSKVDQYGRFVSFDEHLSGDSNCEPVIYEPGLEIMSRGNIHSLAFISQLFVRSKFWNQSFHDSIYTDNDLYTHVLTLLSESVERRTADIDLHVVTATDRGDRSYYIPKMCVARLTEYNNYDKLVHDSFSRRKARRILKNGRKRFLKKRIASCFKLIGYSDNYQIAGSDPISFMRSFTSPYLIDQFVVRGLAFLGSFCWSRQVFRVIYSNLYALGVK